MTDYINREAALALLHKEEFGTLDERWHPESEIAEAILRLPAADVAPVRHGRWEKMLQNADGTADYECTACKGLIIDVPDDEEHPLCSYCPNCGAKMDGGEDDGER